MGVINLLAVDLGASNGRVMQATFDGDAMKLEEIHRFPNMPMTHESHTVWDFGWIKKQVQGGIAKAIDTQRDIASVAVDGWAVDFGFLDSNGKLLRDPVHYRDESHPKAMAEVLSRVSPSELFQRTGIQLQPFNTLFQLYARLHENPKSIERAQSMLLIPDLITFFLCGAKAAEFTNASTTQMLSAATGTWDRELLSRLGLPTHLLPNVVSPGQIAGFLTDPELARLVPSQALSKIQVIHAASHDTASAVISVPSESSRVAYISSGTWSLLGTEVERPVTSEQARLYNLTNEGGVKNYRLLKNVMGLWILQEGQRVFVERGEPHSISDLLQQAERAAPLRCLFNPNDPRLLHPSDMVETVRQICRETGQEAPDDAGSFVRSVLDSLSLAYREALLQLEEVAGTRFDAVHVVGGGSQNHRLNQFTANATNRVVKAGPVEASAIGNALVQLLALGHVSSRREMKDVVMRSFGAVTYEPKDVAAWDAAYERFQQISQRQFKGE